MVAAAAAASAVDSSVESLAVSSADMRRIAGRTARADRPKAHRLRCRQAPAAESLTNRPPPLSPQIKVRDFPAAAAISAAPPAAETPAVAVAGARRRAEISKEKCATKARSDEGNTKKTKAVSYQLAAATAIQTNLWLTAYSCKLTAFLLRAFFVRLRGALRRDVIIRPRSLPALPSSNSTPRRSSA